MNRLLKIGFRNIGSWKLAEGKPAFELTTMMNTSNVLYAFVSNGDVKYIGKTTQPLKKRMYGYQNPGPTQSTNIRNRQRLQKLLSEGEPVDIFALSDNGLLHYGDFHLNLAGGLEDSLVFTLSPEWNDTGKKRPRSKSVIGKPKALVVESPSRPVFGLTLHETYYRTGFFNITVDFDRYIGEDKTVIDMLVDDSDQIIQGYINRTANTNGTPRIMGGKELRDWFQENFNVGDGVDVEILSPSSIRLSPHFSQLQQKKAPCFGITY